MDALEFLRERKRMCNSYKGCEDCPLAKGRCVIGTSDEDCERIIATVERWSKEHPIDRKTRQSVFLERYPEAKIDNTGVLDVCPTLIVYSHRKDEGECIDINRKCFVCRREFWMQEVE